MSNISFTEQLEILRSHGNLQTSERFQYVTIHALPVFHYMMVYVPPDQRVVLRRVELDRAKRRARDPRWPVGGQLAFVSIVGNRDAQPFVTYREKVGGDVVDRFHISTRNMSLTREKIESALEWIAEWLHNPGKHNDIKFRGVLRICDADIIG